MKIDNILRVDLDGDGEEEVLISATNYFSQDDRVPMRSPAGELFDGVIAARRRRKSGDTGDCRRISPQGLSVRPQGGASFDAPNTYKVIATLDLDGDGKLEIVVGSNYYEGEETPFTMRSEKG